MEPTRPAAANRVYDGFQELAGRLISRPFGGLAGVFARGEPMKLYRLVLWGSALVFVVGAVLPLITLRSFEGYPQAWLSYLSVIAPAALLLVVLVLLPRISPRAMRVLTLTSMAVVAIGWMFGRVNILFLLLFLAGALAMLLRLQSAQSVGRDVQRGDSIR
jgi:hypothetical protein